MTIDPAEAAIGPENVKIGVWEARLVLFHRIAGGFMMFKGLLYWATLLAIVGRPFTELPTNAQGTTIFFAIVDLIAGVGLWLGSAWGGALWLIAATLQVLAGISFVEQHDFFVLLTIIELLLIASYVVLRFLAHYEEVR